MRSGEPSAPQIIAYFFADRAGRTRRTARCRIGFQRKSRDLDHAAVRQKLREIAPDRGRRRRVGRSQVEQQYADAARLSCSHLGSARNALIGIACFARRSQARRATRSRRILRAPFGQRFRRLRAHAALHGRKPAEQARPSADRLPQPAPEVEAVDVPHDATFAERELRVDAILDVPSRSRVRVRRDPMGRPEKSLASTFDATTARSLPRAHSMRHIAATPAASRSRTTGSENVASGA
jgi:hypothetical protein